MLIGDLLARSARTYPDLPALVDETRSVSFSELAAEVRRLAAGLARLGLARGDRVAVISKNRAEFVCIYFATMGLGAVVVPLNWRLRANETAALLRHSEAKLLFVENEFGTVLHESKSEFPALEHVIGLGDEEGATLAYAELVSGPSAAETTAPVDEGDVAIQMYTSGTTGVPKGAMLTHGNVMAMTASWLDEIGLVPAHDRFLQVTPLFHVGGMLMMTSNAAAGTTLVLHREFQPPLARRDLVRLEITHALFVPSMIQWLLLDAGDGACSFPHLRLVIYGASPVSKDVLERAMEMFDCSFLQGYGLTETAGVLTVLRPEDHRGAPGPERDARLASAGRAIGCCEVRVVDGSGQRVAEGEIGEVVARGANICAGYWKMPVETEETLCDGWFHTGDLARVDAEGYVTIVDRKKDMILVGGENVYPNEIERVLAEHRDVLDSCVIGIPHDVWGEEVLALVAREKGASVTDRELIGYCRERLARFKCPTRLEFRDDIPRNPAGKIEKKALREPYWRSCERKV